MTDMRDKLAEELALHFNEPNGQLLSAADAIIAALPGIAVPQWQPIETAPTWVEVLVKYKGPRHVKSQPSCVATSVKVSDGTWALGSMADYKIPTHWMPLPKPPHSS